MAVESVTRDAVAVARSMLIAGECDVAGVAVTVADAWGDGRVWVARSSPG